MKIDDDHFSPAEEIKFWTGVTILILAAVLIAFAIHGWEMYQQTVAVSNANSKPQATNATVLFNIDEVSNKVEQSSLSPSTNSN